MKESMVILNGVTFGTAMERVRRVFPMDSFILVPLNDGTTLAIRHDVAEQRGIDKRVKYLPKPVEHFYSYQELIGWATCKGFSFMSINDGDGWEPRRPLTTQGYIPRWWGEFKFRFYLNLHSHWSESLTLYPSPEGNGLFYHAKELF